MHRWASEVKVGMRISGYFRVGKDNKRGEDMAFGWGAPWTVTKIVVTENGTTRLTGTSGKDDFYGPKGMEAYFLTMGPNDGFIEAPPERVLQGVHTTDEAPGAMKNGTRAMKKNSVPMDAHGDGARCTIVGSVRDGDEIGYFVEWDDWPGIACGIVASRLTKAD